MDFTNFTNFPAKILTGSMGDTEMLGIIASKVTYTLQENRLVSVPEEQAWPVFDKPFQFEGVTLQSELDFRKNGIDILVFGKAVAPYGQQITELPVVVECGKYRYQVQVFGDRVWQKSKEGLVPGRPKPFSEMPLTNDRAFGGVSPYQGMEMPHWVNPDGRGCYISEEDAEGNPLPNLERPDSLITSWDNYPLPACFQKPPGLLEQYPEQSPEQIACDVMESGFNQTIPELIIADAKELGSTIRFQGFSPYGDILFPVPRLDGPTAHVAVGKIRSRFPSAISSMLFLVNEKILIVTYLCLFRYLMRPMELRSVELRWAGDPTVKLEEQAEKANRSRTASLVSPGSTGIGLTGIKIPQPISFDEIPPPPIPPSLQTPAPSTLRVTQVVPPDQETQELAVIYKCTYVFEYNSPCRLADEQLPLDDDGELHDPIAPDIQPSAKSLPEVIGLKTGTDLIVQGSACPARPVSEMTVSVQVGKHIHSAVVFGQRFCDYSNGKIVFTPPELLEDLPLRYENAYGGRDRQAEQALFEEVKRITPPDKLRRAMPSVEAMLGENNPLMYPRNRFGKGYVLENRREFIQGRDLPNIERHDDRLTPERLVVRNPFTWFEQPVPIGFDYLDPLSFPRSAMVGMPPPGPEDYDALPEVVNDFVPAGFCRGNVFAVKASNIHTLIHPWASRCASLGLWLPFLRGNEEIVVTGMDRQFPIFRVRLPAQRPEFSIDGLPHDAREIRPEPHLISINMSEKLLNVIWVGRTPLPRPLRPGEDQEIAAAVKIRIKEL